MSLEDFDSLFLENMSSLKKHLLIKSNYNDILSEDLVHETYIKAREAIKRGKYKERGKFSGWIKFLSLNLLIDFWRKQKVQNKFLNFDTSIFDIMNFLIDDFNIEDDLISRESEERIIFLVDRLPEEQKEVFEMRINGMLFKDISESKGEPLNTVLGRMRYARINLKRNMK